MKAFQAFHSIFLASSASSSLLFQLDLQPTHCSLDILHILLSECSCPPSSYSIKIWLIFSKPVSCTLMVLRVLSTLRGVPGSLSGGAHGQTYFHNTKTLVLFHVFALLTFILVVQIIGKTADTLRFKAVVPCTGNRESQFHLRMSCIKAVRLIKHIF